MLRTKPSLFLLTAAVLLFAGSCANDSLDQGDSADVILEIEALENPSVTATLDMATGICTFQIDKWSFSARNEPKNSLATGPFNDISLISVDISYAWISGAVTPDRTVGLGGVIIPVGSTAQVEFEPIAFDDLNIGLAGSAANLTMTFNAVTVEGTTLSTTVFRQLSVESCA